MRFCLRTALLVCLVLLAGPIPAHAGLAALIDMLDNLSGPGPFGGFGIQADVLCSTPEFRPTWKCTWPFDKSVDQDVKPFVVGPHFSWMNGKTNPDVVYADGVPEANKEVDLFTYGIYGTANFTSRYGATVRFTRYRFYRPHVDDSSVTRSAIILGPVVSFPRRTNKYSRYVAISPLVILGLGQFTPQDFGAVEPQFESDNVKFTLNVNFGL